MTKSTIYVLLLALLCFFDTPALAADGNDGNDVNDGIDGGTMEMNPVDNNIINRTEHNILEHNNNNNNIINTKTTSTTNTPHRIAILIPFLSNSVPILPSYFPLFIQSIEGLSPLIDFFLFHNGQLTPLIHTHTTPSSNSSRSTIIDMEIPNNLKIIDLKSTSNYAKQILQVMNFKKQHQKNHPKEKSYTEEEYKILQQAYEQLITKDPYVLIEIKPALGYIFRSYIPQSKYTHWGYSDLDVYFGDLQKWITQDELNYFDIVTYGFGDQSKVYLRGQFTFHKNDVDEIEEGEGANEDNTETKTKGIHLLWTKCNYLYNLDVRIAILLNEHKFRRVSAEGCYSSVVISSSKEKKLNVKYAVKAWTNPSKNQVMDEYGVSTIFVNDDKKHRRNILFKKSKDASADEYLQTISQINSQTISSLDDTPMQWDVGEIEPIFTKDEGSCMAWVDQKDQKHLCVSPKSDVGSSHTVYLINGQLYRRKFKERNDLFFLKTDKEKREHGEGVRVEHPIVVSRPIFHVQEWKRSYRSTQLLSMKVPKENILGWMFYPQGSIPILDKYQAKKKSNNEIILNNSFTLPSQEYCLVLKNQKQSGQYKDYCKWVVSWYDKNLIKIVGPAWNSDRNSDTISSTVTLSLTLQITTLPDKKVDEIEIDSILQVIKANISIWKNQPWILFVCIVGNESKSTSEKIRNDLDKIIGFVGSTNYLIGIIESKDHATKDNEGNIVPLSRKALLNLAESASYTRWTITGLDIENKMILSKDMLHFAEKAASSHKNDRGYAFIIPDFNFVDKLSPEKIYSKRLSLVDLDDYQHKKQIRPNTFYNAENDIDDNSNSLIGNIQESFHTLWKTYSKEVNSVSNTINQTAIASDLAIKLDIIQTELNRLILDEHMNAMRQSSKAALMIDKYSPMNGLSTQYVATEMDELGGCFNLMRLVQLSLLNYKIQPLFGSFSITQTPLSANSDLCKSLGNVDKILKEERKRIVKFMIIHTG